MPAYFLMVSETEMDAVRRIDFVAESPDQAFQVARNVTDGTYCELWESEKLLARMTKSGGQLWQLLPTILDETEQSEQASSLSAAGAI